VSRSFRASNIHNLVSTGETAPYDNSPRRRSRRRRVLAHLVRSNQGRVGGDARFTCVGSGGLWRKERRLSTRGRTAHRVSALAFAMARSPTPDTLSAPASPLKDTPMIQAADDRLRDEVRMLGGLLGEVILAEGGRELYDRIEAVRQASVAWHRDAGSADAE